MASLALTFGDIYTQVSDFLRYSSPTGDTLTLVKDIVKRAYRRFLYPVHPESGLLHTWSFLRRKGRLSTKINEYRYQLPTDFVTMLTSPKMVAGENLLNPEYIDIAKFNGFRTKSTDGDVPQFYCVDIGEYHKEFGQLHELKFWKTPNLVYNYEYEYVFEPQAPENSTDFLVGGVRASEVILAMSLAEAEQQEDEDSGVQATRASKLLLAYMAWDKAYAMNAFGPGWDDARQEDRPVTEETNGS